MTAPGSAESPEISPFQIVIRTLRPVFVACAAGAVGSAFLDVGRAAFQSGEPLAAGVLLSSLLAAVGLYGAAALLFGTALGLVAGSVRAVLPAGFAKGIRERLAGDRDLDLSVAAGVLAAGAAAGLVAIIVFLFTRGFALDMASRRNGALSTALVAVASLPLSALGWFPLYLLIRIPARLLPRPRILAALGGMLGLSVLGVAAAVLSVDWRVINFGPFLALGWFALLAGGHLWFWNRGPGVGLEARVPPSVLRAARAGIVVVPALLFISTILGFGDEPRSLALLSEQTAGARPLFHAVRRVADRDHDGYAAILGGGDCNDRDPAVNPAATDEPGNGRDEDCSGSDAEAVVQPIKTPPGPVAQNKDRAAAKETGTAAAPAKGAFGGNLLIITIDTLRADRLDEKTMPHLAAFAKNATVFTHAWAQAPNTPRSFPSFLTSRYPSQIKWAHEAANFSPILDENKTFFESLHEAGLRTIGIFSHFYLDPKNGVSQGFDEWDNEGALTLHDSNTDSAAPRITRRVLARLQALASSKQRFALWTHYFEPHSRYMEHPEFPAHGSGFKALEEKYDGEVSFVDQYIQKVLDELQASGLDKTTTVVIFSDHGEAFGEHRFAGEQMFFHGQTLYDELLRVPLLVRVPGSLGTLAGAASTGRRVDERVMLIDLGPTLVDLVGGVVPEAFEGRSLVGALRGEALPEKRVYAELLPATSWQHSWRILIDGKYKLLDKISENTIELYDIEKDPTEKHNLALSETADANRMKQQLRQFMTALKAQKAVAGDARTPQTTAKAAP